MDTIIVADDSKIIQNLIQKAIGENINVLLAADGKEAIEQLSRAANTTIGILLDLNMPEYDGFTVLDYFKTNNLFKKYPVVIISGDDSKETIERAFTYQILDLLNKPFSKDNIANVIEKMKNSKMSI